MRLMKKLGMVLLQPKRAFEVIAIDEQEPLETASLTAFIFLIVTAITRITRNNVLSSIISGAIFVAAWLGAAIIFAVVVKAIYRVPGSAKQFFSITLYAQVSLILPIIATLLYMNYQNVITMEILIASCFVWFAWNLILVYFGARAYFRIDIKQFFVALIATLTILFIIIVVIALISYTVFLVSLL